MIGRNKNEGINTRISHLLQKESAQCSYRGEALIAYKDEAVRRIERIGSIYGSNIDGKSVDELKNIFFLQFEKAVNDRKYLTHIFKRKNKDTKVIDADDFNAYMNAEIPLLSPGGLISNKEDLTSCKNIIHARIKTLKKKHNYYINVALSRFIDEKTQLLNRTFKLIQLKPEDVIDVQNVFIERLEKFNFTEAYTRLDHENKGNKFERKKCDPFDCDIEYTSFDSKMSNVISFHQPDNFIATALKISQRKEQLLGTVDKIVDEINHYTSDNKKNIIQSFNSSMKYVRQLLSDDTIKSKGFFASANAAKTEIENSLKTIQASENDYYKGRFFAEYRQSNSSLQPKISKAREILDNFQVGVKNTAKCR